MLKDIESENCVVFNDELGCSACQVRIRMLELKRFSQMKEKYKQFDIFLNDVESLSEFVERKIHLNEKFLDTYEQVYMADKDEDERKKNSLANEVVITPENNQELYDQLFKRNVELLDSIDLDVIPKLNVAKELPCEVFQLQYETYRTKVIFFCIKRRSFGNIITFLFFKYF